MDPYAGGRAIDALHAQSEGHVVPDIPVREQGVVLEHQADATLVGRYARHVPACQTDPPGPRLLEARQRAQQRGLAAPARAQEAEQLACRDGQVDVADGVAPAVRHSQTGDLEQGRSGRRDDAARMARHPRRPAALRHATARRAAW